MMMTMMTMLLWMTMPLLFSLEVLLSLSLSLSLQSMITSKSKYDKLQFTNSAKQTRRDATLLILTSKKSSIQRKAKEMSDKDRAGGGGAQNKSEDRRFDKQRSRNQESHSMYGSIQLSLFFRVRTYVHTYRYVQRQQDVFERSEVETFACFLFLSINDWIKFNTALLASYYYTQEVIWLSHKRAYRVPLSLN